jgi:hypothetical protein
METPISNKRRLRTKFCHELGLATSRAEKVLIELTALTALRSRAMSDQIIAGQDIDDEDFVRVVWVSFADLIVAISGKGPVSSFPLGPDDLGQKHERAPEASSRWTRRWGGRSASASLPCRLTVTRSNICRSEPKLVVQLTSYICRRLSYRQIL